MKLSEHLHPLAEVPELGTPLASLEALLASRASAPPRMPGPINIHPPPSLEVVHASAARPSPPCRDLDAELLLVHSGSSESMLAQAWMRNVLDGARLHSVRFQEGVDEQVLLRLPNIVFVHFDPSTIELATRLVTQLRASHPRLPLVATGRARHAQCTLAALRAGVQDFLDMDGGEAAAREMVMEQLRRSPSPPVDESGSAPMTAVLSARAGLGSSLLASHLAWYLQLQFTARDSGASTLQPTEDGADEPLHTLLIDLGHPSGDCSTYLNTYGEFDFNEAVRNLRRFDRRLASSGLARHDSGLRLLGLPRYHQKQDAGQADTDMLVLRLRQYFRHIVADLGAVLHSGPGLRMAARASEIWLVCDQSVASVVSSAHLLTQLAEHKVDRQHIQLVVNRCDNHLELEPDQIAQHLKLPLLAVVPERRAELTKAVNQGQLLPPGQRREPYVQALQQLATRCIDAHHDALASPPPSGRTGLGRLFQRIRSQ